MVLAVLLLDTVYTQWLSARVPVHGEYRGCREFRGDATLVISLRYFEALDDRLQHLRPSKADGQRILTYQYLRYRQMALW